MKRAVLFGLVFLLLVGGCFEDEVELTLNADGSGGVKQRIVISERLLVASSQGRANSQAPPLNKEDIIKHIGSALDIKSVSQKDLPDGSRVIELQGTFRNPEQFFLSDFCIKGLKLRLSPAGAGKAGLYCELLESQGMEVDLSRVYSMAKGLYVKRTIHLPGEVETTNVRLGEDKRTVSWALDLRDADGLKKAKEFIEGPSGGEVKVVFDASALKFKLPLKAEKVASAAAPAEPNLGAVDPSQIKAGVSWVAVTRATKVDGSLIPKKSYAELGIELTWSEGNRPVRCEDVVLLSVLDDTGTSLVAGSKLVSAGYQLKVYEHDKSKELKLKIKAPSPSAKKLKDIEGYAEVITQQVEKTVVLDNVRELVGKETTGNAVLDKLGIRIKKITDMSIEVVVKAGTKKLVSLDMIKNDGSKARKSGGGGSSEDYRYDFRENISGVNKCEIVVITDQTKAKIPFSLAEMALP